MSTKWTTNGSPSTDAPVAAAAAALPANFVVLLLYGKNSFGDKIYSYVKVSLPNLPRLKSGVLSGKPFTPSDFGEVLAAGKGEPSAEVRAEIAALYPITDSRGVPRAPLAAKPEEKKNWDEY